MSPTAKTAELLAVDVGLKAGLAWFDRNGRLMGYRSTNFGTRRRLRAGVHSILRAHPNLRRLVLEGGGGIADTWATVATRNGLVVTQVTAETWRDALLLDREQRSGSSAKKHASDLARRVIEWSDAPRPTSLRHDAAEAILVGLWAVLQLGWLPDLPRELRR